MEKSLAKLIAAAFCAVIFHVGAADITWGEAQNITGDSDVCTNGLLRYAYANTTATVNGVKFSAGINKTSFPDGVATKADVVLTSFKSCNVNTTYFANAVPEGASDDYLQLIKAGVYATSASASESVTSTVTLTNLISGHDYIVQLWTQDYRSNVGSHRSIKVDDSVELQQRVSSTGFGQHITGSFTADAEAQSFTVVGYSDGTITAVSMFNSIQLRDVTPGCIEWEEAEDIAADYDVRLDGEPVFAAGWMAATAVVNSVVFVPLTPTNSTTVYADVKMTLDTFSGRNHTEFVNGVEQALSDDYSRLLGGATYNAKSGVGTVTFDGLEEGGRYLVQLWINDTREEVGPYRLAAIDGGQRVLFRNGTYGQHITGLFTATSSSQSIVIHPMYIPTTKMTFCPPQVNAVQLRRLDVGASTHWRVSPITKSVLDVRTEGDLLYAYNFAKTAVTSKVNGVEFTGIPKDTANGGNDDFGLAFAAFSNGHDTAFNFTDTDTSSGYITMLKSAVYSKGGSYDATPSTLTLKQLTPGRRYLVQIWLNDPRIGDMSDRYQILDGEASMEFSDEASGITPLRGDVATGLFTATATNQAISIQSGHWTNESYRAVQLNGMQVRDLGEAQGLTILVEDVPMWHVASGATADLDGATRSLGTVSGSGAITNGTVSGALVVSDGSAITLKDVTLSSGITLNGASSVTFDEDVDLSGMAITISDPASQAEIGTPIIMSTGTLSGTPEFTFACGGYTAKLTDDGYIVQKIPGMIILVR